jgi:hypothetical protein
MFLFLNIRYSPPEQVDFVCSRKRRFEKIKLAFSSFQSPAVTKNVIRESSGRDRRTNQQNLNARAQISIWQINSNVLKTIL